MSFICVLVFSLENLSHISFVFHFRKYRNEENSEFASQWNNAIGTSFKIRVYDNALPVQYLVAQLSLYLHHLWYSTSIQQYVVPRLSTGNKTVESLASSPNRPIGHNCRCWRWGSRCCTHASWADQTQNPPDILRHKKVSPTVFNRNALCNMGSYSRYRFSKRVIGFLSQYVSIGSAFTKRSRYYCDDLNSYVIVLRLLSTSVRLVDM